MITLYFGDTPYQFPNRWEELTQDQYLALVELIMQYYAEKITMCELRVMWFMKIAGLEKTKVRRGSRERFTDNVLTASRQFDFFYKLDYAGQIDALSPEIKKILRKTSPDEVNSSNSEIRYARQLEYSYQLDAVWAKNLIPSISLGDGRILSGWSATLGSGTLQTSLTSKQYTAGYDLLSLIHAGGRGVMVLLTGLLYGVDDGDAVTLALIEQQPDAVLNGVVLNFQAFVSFVFSRTHFSILWNAGGDRSGEKADGKVALAMSDSLYNLCENGYGDYEKVETMPMMTFLTIIRKDFINSVRTMAASGVELDKIAERTHLSISQIKKIL